MMGNNTAPLHMHRMRPLAVIVLVACHAVLSHPALAGTVRGYTGGVTFGTDSGFPDGPCLSIRGVVSAPQFFKDLKRRETSRGIEFRRGADVVQFFPKELSVRILIREFPCHVGLTQVSPLLMTTEKMSSLRFAAFWKQGMQMRPVENLTRPTFYRRREQPTALVGVPVTIQRDTWVYEFTVSSRDVPLTDDLILEIFNQDGTRVVRVSARL